MQIKKWISKYLAWRKSNQSHSSLNMRQAYQGGWVSWIPAAATVASSLISSDASQSAAQTQANAADQAAQTQRYMFDTVNSQQAPYREAGTTALKNLLYGAGIDGSTGGNSGSLLKPFTAADLGTNLSPNYQFMLDQGLGATKNAANLQTGLLSGNSLKAISDYTINNASNAYQNAFNNYQTNQTNIYNRLASIAGLGQTAANNTGQAAMTAGGNIGSAQLAAGAAQAAGTVGSANALSSGINNAASWYQLKNIMNGGGISGGGSGAYDNSYGMP